MNEGSPMPYAPYLRRPAANSTPSEATPRTHVAPPRAGSGWDLGAVPARSPAAATDAPIQRAKVKNLTRTAHLRSHTKRSWKHHYLAKAPGWGKCRAHGCRRFAQVGAHVEVDGEGSHTRNRYIVPFCQKHNKRNTTVHGALRVKPGTKLVSVGKTHTVRTL